MTDQPATDLTRRGVIRGAAVGGLTLPLLAACGEAASPPSGTSSPDGSGGSPSRSGGGVAVSVPTSEVPVGGGSILVDDADRVYVVTQPTAGEFKAFSGICTHQQCPVSQITDGEIICTCHGSRYSVEDGSVLGGPAPRPLPGLSASVQGDEVTVEA